MRADARAGTQTIIEQFGPELRGFIKGFVRDYDAAQDIFSDVCVDIWKGLPGFRGECALRAWLYTIARRACARYFRAPYRRRRRALSTAEVAFLDERMRLLNSEDVLRGVAHSEAIYALGTRTSLPLQSGMGAEVISLCEALTPKEQALLVLRIERGMPFDDIARALHGGELTDSERKRLAATYRKRFERTKERLRKLAIERGLLRDSRRLA